MTDPLNGIWLDKNGAPISLEQWGAYKADESYSVIGRDTVGPYVVSTVWLGLDHGFGHSSQPVIFETMVFPAADWNSDGPGLPEADEFDMQRYTTEVQARAGHDQFVAEVRAVVADLFEDH